jgi:hypothetical protein
MACACACASSAAAACGPFSPVPEMRAAISPETTGVEKEVPLQRHMPSKVRDWPKFGGSSHMYNPLAYALTRPSPGAKTSTQEP